MFDELKDIEVREETQVQKSDLEKVLSTEKEILTIYENDIREMSHLGAELELYDEILCTSREKLKKIKMQSTTLQEYVRSRENNDEDPQQIIRGMYSAALLEIICTAQPDVQINVDCEKRTFNFLFYCTRNAANVTLQNVKGYWIFGEAGNKGGKIENIVLKNVTGNHTLYHAGREGIARYITCIQIKGDNLLYSACDFGGEAEHILCTNIKGDNTLHHAGSKERGRIKHAICTHITGNCTLADTGRRGNAEHLTCIQITGDNTLSTVANSEVTIKNVTFRDIKEKNPTLSHTGISGSCFNCPREYTLTQKQITLLEKIKKITESIHAFSFSETRLAHDEIARLQIEIFAGDT